MSKPAIYSESAAELYRRDAGEKYQPSNGTEGEIFMAAWCYRCARWNEDGCDIAAATMFYDVDEPGYPEEWRIGEDGQPECTAYGSKYAKPAPAKDERQADLFEATP